MGARRNNASGQSQDLRRFSYKDQTFDYEIDAEFSDRADLQTQRATCENGGSFMTVETTHDLPICKVLLEDPRRPPLSRRIKDLGMKAAGRVATVLRHLPRQRAENEFGILVYHRVAPLQPNCARPSFNVPPDCFREQITGLRRQGFTLLALQDVLKRTAENEPVPPRTVVITFDDGFESVYEFAWPTLRDLNVPATIFLNTGYLNRQTPFPFDAWGHAYTDTVPPVCYRPLTDAQCKEMAASGLIELGAHTHTHADFRGRVGEFRRDMQICLDQFQELFQITRPTFAFPFGKPNMGFAHKSSVEVVREFGLPCSLTTEAVSARTSDSPFSWGRFHAYEWDNSRTLAAKLLGYYSWAPLMAEGVVQWWKRQWRRSRQTAARTNLSQLAGDCYD